MGVGWHHTSNINIWVFSELNVGPVIMESRREGGIWMGICWHDTSDIDVWVFLRFELNIGPIVV